MWVETQNYQQEYLDIRQKIDNDGTLSDQEKQELSEKYDQECSVIHSETLALCDELKHEIEMFHALRELSREETKMLQAALGIQNQDGFPGPVTYEKLMTYTQENNFMSLEFLRTFKETSEKYSDFEKIFKSKSDQERKNIQSQVWAHEDGVYGKQTFGSIRAALLRSDTQYIRNMFLSGVNTQVAQAETEEPVAVKGRDTTAAEVVEVEATAETEADTVTPELADIETNVTEWKEWKLTLEEKKEALITWSKWTHKLLIKMLQQTLWVWDDGDFWNTSASAALEKHPNITSFEELMKLQWIPLKSDGLLEGNNMQEWKETLRNQYWEFITILEQNLDLPPWIIEAITAQETKYGGWKLTSPTWCKGMMQLSNIAIEDMKTAYRADSRNYRENFHTMNISQILWIEVWTSWVTIWESIPNPIVEELKKINNPDLNDTEYDAAINKIQNFIKDDSSYFNHAVNIILGGIILSGIYHSWGKQDITRTADQYNAAPWERTTYRKNVTEFYNQIQADWYYNRS
jgi:hypothetical protein